mmetsp:Transcript_28974/g.74935  ORF Transcript_28974/g.74935 Transcript_28974/m.74935 type:complete len:126 (-) Transcript_28974:1021-1398(-)
MRTPPSCDPSLAGLSSGGPLENGVLDPQTAELAVVTTTLVEGPPLAGATVTLQVPGLLSPAGATAVEVGSANARASVALLLSVRRARKTADAHAGRLQAEALLFPDSNRASVAQDPPLLAQSSKP